MMRALSMHDLDAQQIKAITEYMFLPDNPIKADATIVLGQTLWQRPLQKAVEIYRAGLSGTLIFTGGFNPKLVGYEALEMQKAWLQMGYPPDKVLIDTKATNTMENILNAKKLLEESGLYKTGMLINLISINWHMRRALETIRHVFSGHNLQIGVVNYPSKYCEPHTWHQNVQGARLVQTEMAKIKAYSL